ncbi:hypothetical protein BDY19DRAFT_725835 [Irpex rosettiformis]|uniref:Uncharacterized protein n=1 Tax=Irpex rosettiformis TaxID=378272 RepID=A0ACB8U8E7_9APHY|nr:hypothetical protein BDY19DRAFT_725835 [Irpex rosettiformis]
MPRVSPNTSGGPVLKAIQAELVIQYSGIRATELKQTAQRDRQDQDDIQRRKTKEDLNALKITLNNFHPLRFIFVWKRGRVRVMWRLKEGSRVHRQLSYLVRNAHDNMQDILCELDMSVSPPFRLLRARFSYIHLQREAHVEGRLEAYTYEFASCCSLGRRAA